MSEPIRTTTVPRREGELIKPGEIVTVEGAEGWTLADRRVWNLLLVNAWSDRLEDPTAVFSVDLAELRGSHRGNERIRETLDKLQTTLVLARLPNGKARKVQMLGGTDLDDEERTAGTLGIRVQQDARAAAAGLGDLCPHGGQGALRLHLEICPQPL